MTHDNTKKVVTFGCKLNLYESEVIEKNLQLANLDNVLVFNTCTVTQEATKQTCQAIRKAKQQNPDVKIIVTGCAAQVNPELFANMPEVDKVIGNHEKLLPSYYQFNEDKVAVNDIMQVKETAGHLVQNFDGRSRAFIQIQNGCNHRCTFCIIPFARGNSRSVPLGLIIKQLQHFVNVGYNEVVFTGVDITDYGLDLPGSTTLAQMIKRSLKLVPDLQRFRLSSIDVAEIDDELFELMAQEERLMPHFHISLQAGDDMILKRMKRRHRRKQVIDFCNELRKQRPNVSFGADIIAGFPTESDEMFDNTRNLILEAGLQYLHVFPYSQRNGTPATRMPQVARSTIKSRAAILRQEGEKQLHNFFKAAVGSHVKLLCEHNNIAHTENFIPVKFNGTPGSIIDAQLVAIDSQFMIAKSMHEKTI